MTARSRLGRRTDQTGAVALLSAVVAVVLLVVAAFAVDIGGTWARRGQLQVQADQAALLAAESLPASSDGQRRTVAAHAAYYIACHTVLGQRKLTPGIPACGPGTTPSSAAIKAYGDVLLNAGMVSFPSPTQVRVTTPPARVDYSFGQAAGAEGTTQQKVAVAKVSSPGDIMPVGLSMNCMLTVANNLPAGLGSTLSGVLPLNYIAPGPLTVPTATTKWPAESEQPTSNLVAIQSITPGEITQGIGSGFTVSGTGWGTLTSDVDVYFAQGEGAARRMVKADTVGVSLLDVLAVYSGTVPAEVVNNPGAWRVKVAVDRLFGSRTWSKHDLELQVKLPTVTADILGCGRLLKSPRNYQDGTPLNLQRNLKEGLDHALTSNSSLFSLSPPSPTVPDILNFLGGPAGAFKCANGTHTTDNGGNVQAGKVPDCVVLQQGSSTYTEFTEGILGAEETITLQDGQTKKVAGRLVCTSARPCKESFTLDAFPGRLINDDEFDDYVLADRRNLLTEEMFFNLSTFLTPGLPVVTPESALSPDIYSSHRFFWVPVMSVPINPNSGNANDAGAYPILTFRPVFVTQDHPAGIDAVDMVLDLVTLWVRSLLGITATDDHGILMQGNQLRALRFMTIEPGALPAIPGSYRGPTSEYVGTGPRIIQLVK